jgi:hypothetical protein
LIFSFIILLDIHSFAYNKGSVMRKISSFILVLVVLGCSTGKKSDEQAFLDSLRQPNIGRTHDI